METKHVGIYVHIPFCKQKCQYCDFKSYAGKENLIQEYMKYVIQELAEVGDGNRLDYEEKIDKLAIVNTIYIGGGTPSLIDSHYIVEVMDTIKEHYSLAETVEATIEVNPGTVTEQKLKDYFESGINRISIGLQSTKPELLALLGRIHTYEEFEKTYRLARKCGFKNINIDFMIGLPTQTVEDVQTSLNKMIFLNPEHISVYSLIVEENTPFHEKVEKGILHLPEEEEERQMYWNVKKTLEQNGYEHYEISNFAKPGFSSKHNTNCWEQEEYIGIGAAAHSYTNQVRYSNVDTIEEYIKNYQNGTIADNFIFHEKQDKTSQMKEYMLLGLRKIKGVQVQKFKNKFGENPIYLYRKELAKLVEEGLLEIDGDEIKLTNKGLDLANLVWEEFV